MFITLIENENEIICRLILSGCFSKPQSMVLAYKLNSEPFLHLLKCAFFSAIISGRGDPAKDTSRPI